MFSSPLHVIESWMRHVNEGDIESLLKLYDHGALLIPTFSNRLLNTPEKLREYFERLSSHEELSIALHEKTVITQETKDKNVFMVGGIYNWRFAVDGELLNFQARFSYVMDISQSNPILHHHSSQIPRTL